ncbi:hypothetical protein B0T10DRAFT_611333 [Thelonectria olida]|uniref:Uncharacterized protein n=1 Tax=Thelonectria olida TaxID=1576542 RepID=A0A9P8VR66_9HYPO|nr:hypothetical protein B0T10DRAFT_611333 [Thelonectria olida]
MAMDALKTLATNVTGWMKRLDDLGGEIDQRQVELAAVAAIEGKSAKTRQDAAKITQIKRLAEADVSEEDKEDSDKNGLQALPSFSREELKLVKETGELEKAWTRRPATIRRPILSS